MKKTYKIADHVAWRKVGDEIVVLDLKTNAYYSLNETGIVVWEGLAKKQALPALVEAVVDQCDVSPELAAKDAEGFVKRLCEMKLISPD
jgi:hypothetical protein